MLKRFRIGDLGDIYTGNTPSKKNMEFYDSEDIMFIKPDMLEFNIAKIEKANEYISEKAREKARIIPKGSLLVSCIGNIGKLGINNEEVAFNQQINAIVHNDKIISSKYLAYVIKYNQKKLESIANTAVVPIINKNQFSEFELLIHKDLEIQNKIVDILDKAQQLIDKRKEQIEALDELVKSQFIEMFGSPSNNPKQFDVVEFNKIIEYIGDIGSNGANSVISANLKMTDTEDYALMVRTTNFTTNDFKNNVKYVSKEVYDFFKKSKIYGGELIFNKIGSAGINFVMPNLNRPVSLGLNQIMVRTNNKVNMVYLHNLLNTDYGIHQINRRVQGAVTKSITKGAIKEIPIMLPQIELQNQFADFVKQVDKLKFEMEKSLKELEDNFNSLMQKAFNGELFS